MKGVGFHITSKIFHRRRHWPWSAHSVNQGSLTPMTQFAQMSHPDSVGSPREAPSTYQLTGPLTAPPPAPDDGLDEVVDEFPDGGEGGGLFPLPPRKLEESDSLELSIDGAGLAGPLLGGSVCTIYFSSGLNGT